MHAWTRIIFRQYRKEGIREAIIKLLRIAVPSFSGIVGAIILYDLLRSIRLTNCFLRQ